MKLNTIFAYIITIMVMISFYTGEIQQTLFSERYKWFWLVISLSWIFNLYNFIFKYELYEKEN